VTAARLGLLAAGLLAPVGPAQAEPSPEGAAAAALLEKTYGGRICARAPHEGSEDTEWAATLNAVTQTCASLGCVSELPGPAGRCARPSTEADCGGMAIHPATGLCATPTLALHPSSERLRPRRFLMTATAYLRSDLDGYGGAHPAVFPGVFLQLALTRARGVRTPEGGWLWDQIGRWYLHGGIFGGTGLVGHDVGLVVRLPHQSLTRLGLSAHGQYLDEPTPTSKRAYRVGPALHVELLHNLLFRVGWLPLGTAVGPRWMIGLEYAAGLIDDLKLTAQGTSADPR
jgi:hypothetical protein